MRSFRSSGSHADLVLLLAGMLGHPLLGAERHGEHEHRGRVQMKARLDEPVDCCSATVANGPQHEAGAISAVSMGRRARRGSLTASERQLKFCGRIDDLEET